MSAGPDEWRSWFGTGSLLITGCSTPVETKATNFRRLSVVAVNVVLPEADAVSIIFGANGSVTSQT